MRGIWVVALGVAMSASAAAGQAQRRTPEWETKAGGKMAFEVASVRLSNPDKRMPNSVSLNAEDGDAPTGDNFTADAPLDVYITFAYKLWLSPEEGRALRASLPKWSGDRYTIVARAAGNPTKDQLRLMMQALLVERFKLALHFETRETNVLALRLVKAGKTGPKLIAHAAGPACDVREGKVANDGPGKDGAIYPPVCGVSVFSPAAHHQNLLAGRNTRMELMGPILATLGRLGLPVVDQTGLAGNVDFAMVWLPEVRADAPPEPDADGPTFLEALGDQLGLKLDAVKAPLAVLVVDHVEKPAEN